MQGSPLRSGAGKEGAWVTKQGRKRARLCPHGAGTLTAAPSTASAPGSHRPELPRLLGGARVLRTRTPSLTGKRPSPQLQEGRAET